MDLEGSVETLHERFPLGPQSETLKCGIREYPVFNVPPLSHVHRFDDPWNLIDESDGAGDVVENVHVSNLLPRHRHVFQELQDGMRHVLQRTEVDSFVVTVLPRRHVSVIANNLTQVLRRHILFLSVDEPEFPLFRVSLRLELLPLASFKRESSRISYGELVSYPSRGGFRARTPRIAFRIDVT